MDSKKALVYKNQNNDIYFVCFPSDLSAIYVQSAQIIQSAHMSQKQDGHNIYAIMKAMCPPGYLHNGFAATHALVVMTGMVHGTLLRLLS